MTPGNLYAELVRLQDDYITKEKAAKAKKPLSPQAVARDAALTAYDVFKKGLATDLRIMLGCAAEERIALDEITRRVVIELAERMNFDAVSAQVHHANVKAMEARHEAEQLRREIEMLRKQVERMLIENEQKLRLAG